MTVRRRQIPSGGTASPPERPGLGDLLIADGQDFVAADVNSTTDLAYVTEEMDFRQSDTQMVETVETTTLDASGRRTSVSVKVHGVH